MMSSKFLQEYLLLKDELVRVNAEALHMFTLCKGFKRLIMKDFSFSYLSEFYSFLEQLEPVINKLEQKSIEIYRKMEEVGDDFPKEEKEFLDKQFQFLVRSGSSDIVIGTTASLEVKGVPISLTLQDSFHKIKAFLYDKNRRGDCYYLEHIDDKLYMSVSYLLGAADSHIVIFPEIVYSLFELTNIIVSEEAKGRNVYNYSLVLSSIYNDIINKINIELELDINLDFFQWVQNDRNLEELSNLWWQVVQKRKLDIFREDDESFIPNHSDGFFSTLVDSQILYLEKKFPKNIGCEILNDREYYNEGCVEPQANSKTSSAILKVFDSNSNALVAKLKDSGLQLSAAALQNDQNISRVANVVYNLLPGMVRIFVSFDTVENFLLTHRQWLINKLV